MVQNAQKSAPTIRNPKALQYRNHSGRGDGFSIDIAINGTDNVPVALELIFRPGGSFSGTVPHEGMKETVFLKEGMGKYTGNGSSINFGPGLYRHKWVAIRGALPKMDAPTAFLTGTTPFHHSIKIS